MLTKLISCQNSDNSIKSNKTLDSTSTSDTAISLKQLDTIQCVDDSIVFRCLSNCAGDCKTDLKSNGELPFKINKSVLNDTVKVVFHFVSDGCQKFIKVTKITKDTIYLDYKIKSNSICECYSDYKYEFTIPNCKGKTILLKNKKI